MPVKAHRKGRKSSVVDGWPYPDFNKIKRSDERYEASFWHAQNFARYIYKPKQLAGFFKEWVSKNKFNFSEKALYSLKKLPDYNFTQLGQFAWIESNGGELQDSTYKWIDKRVSTLYEEALKVEEERKQEKEETPDKSNLPQKSAQDTIRENTGNLIALVEDHIDKVDYSFNLYKHVQTLDHAINPQQIHDYYKPLIDELNLVKKDQQVKEAYACFSTKEIREQKRFLESILSDCESLQEAKRRTRKPRKKKPKSIDKVVQSVKYKKEDTDLKVVSIDPSKVVGVQTLWIFNMKTRFLGVYHAKDETGLSFKGTTLQNFDEEKSVAKKVRKPNEKIPEFMEAGKPKTRKFLDTINAVEKPLTGRTNEDILFLRIFK